MENTSLLSIEEIDEKSSTQRYILQINRIKLQDYVKYALIAPDKYLGDEIERDIQSKNQDFLVLSNGYINELNEQQILIELILTDEEKDNLYNANSIWYLDKPLPITRIKRIYAQDKKTIKYILKNFDTAEIGFLAESLFDVYEKNSSIHFQQYSYTPLMEDVQLKSYIEEMLYFDKRLGIFSSIKNIGLYYSSNIISNYSEHYFAILSNFLAQKLEDIPFTGLDILKENDAFKKLLYSNKIMNKEFIQQVADSIDNEEIKNVFLQLIVPNQIRKTLTLLLEKDALLHYYIGLIYYFKQKDSNKKDNFKIDIEPLIPQKYSEVAFAILGIYLGYENLRASEDIKLKDKKFRKIFGSKFVMKFELNSQLDYITIESIYQYCFNEKRKIEVPDYLEYPSVIKQFILPRDKEFKTWYEVEEKTYFDTPYIKIKKKSPEEIIAFKIEKYNNEIVFGKDYLASFIDKYFQNLISYSKDGKPCKPFCKKEDFLEYVKPQITQNSTLELLNVFEMDKK